MISEHQLLAAGDLAGRQQVVRWVRTFPFSFVSQREYVIARRVWRGQDGALYAVTKGVAHPAAPLDGRMVGGGCWGRPSQQGLVLPCAAWLVPRRRLAPAANPVRCHCLPQRLCLASCPGAHGELLQLLAQPHCALPAWQRPPCLRDDVAPL